MKNSLKSNIITEKENKKTIFIFLTSKYMLRKSVKKKSFILSKSLKRKFKRQKN